MFERALRDHGFTTASTNQRPSETVRLQAVSSHEQSVPTRRQRLPASLLWRLAVGELGLPAMEGVEINNYAIEIQDAYICCDDGGSVSGFNFENAGDGEAGQRLKSLKFVNCAFEHGLVFNHAHARSLIFERCELPYLTADSADIAGGVAIREGTVIAHGVSIAGAKVSGDLDFSGARVSQDDRGYAIRAFEIYLSGSFSIRDDACIRGMVNLRGAVIRGILNGSESEFHAPESYNLEQETYHSISALGCEVDGVVAFINSRFVGNVQFSRAVIKGDLNCKGSTFATTCKEEPWALHFSRARIAGFVSLTGVNAKGEVRFRNAEIDGELNASSANLSAFENAGDETVALRCTGTTVGGVVTFEGSTVRGGMRIRALDVGGDLVFRSIQVDCGNAYYAILGSRIKVAHLLILNGGLKARGVVSFVGATISGDAKCSDCTLNAKEDDEKSPLLNSEAGRAIDLSRGEVKGKLTFGSGFISTGLINLSGAKIGQDLEFEACRIHALYDDCMKIAIRADYLVVGHRLSFGDGLDLCGCIDLTAARCRTLSDCEGGWIPRGRGYYYLDGFEYVRLGAASPKTWRKRWRWLQRQNPPDLTREFKPQPWDRAVKVLNDMGHDAQARRLARKKQNYHRRSDNWRDILHGNPILSGYRAIKWWFGCALDVTKGFMTGYGYQPWLSALWSVVVILYGALAFGLANERGAIVPSEEEVLLEVAKYQAMMEMPPPNTQDSKTKKEWEREILLLGHMVNDRRREGDTCAPRQSGHTPQLGGLYPQFRPFVFSLDVFFPFSSFEQQRYWIPRKGCERVSPADIFSAVWTPLMQSILDRITTIDGAGGHLSKAFQTADRFSQRSALSLRRLGSAPAHWMWIGLLGGFFCFVISRSVHSRTVGTVFITAAASLFALGGAIWLFREVEYADIYGAMIALGWIASTFFVAGLTGWVKNF